MSEPDLSGFKVEFRQNLLTKTWTWEMSAPDGQKSLPTSDFMSLAAAEDDALYWMERMANEKPPMNGEDLRERVEARRVAA